jgi:hypothetical protein
MSTITPLPTPPSRSNPTTFSVLADNFLAALPTFVSETNVISADISSKIDTTIAQANAALAAVNAVMWTSKVYAVGDVAWSPINKQSYRCLTAGTRSTDPANDPANWEVVSTRPSHPVITKSTSSTLGVADRSKFLYCTAGFTQYFSPAATLGDGWFVIIKNGTAASSITIDPYGTELSDGLRSFVMYPGETRLFFCDGTGLSSIVLEPFEVTYTSSDTFWKPPGYTGFDCLMWGGGAAGARGNGALGGGGGACCVFRMPESKVSAGGETVTIAASVAGRTTNGQGADGNNSVFCGVTAYGGKGSASGSPGGNAFYNENTFTLQDAFSGFVDDINGYSMPGYMGGAPAPREVGEAQPRETYTVYGGEAGGSIGSTSNLMYSHSLLGGDGGAPSISSSGGNGSVPGGGGGATSSGTKSGDGAAGSLTIIGVI